MTLTPVAKHLAMALSLSVFYDLSLSRPGIESRSPACEANVLPLSHHNGVIFSLCILETKPKVYHVIITSVYLSTFIVKRILESECLYSINT